jgi:NAD(P)-dependent dehydrogenase (short-subunit alcohol dehydrogenase family)
MASALAPEAVRRCGKIDLLVNNAGVLRLTSFENLMLAR